MAELFKVSLRSGNTPKVASSSMVGVTSVPNGIVCEVEHRDVVHGVAVTTDEDCVNLRIPKALFPGSVVFLAPTTEEMVAALCRQMDEIKKRAHEKKQLLKNKARSMSEEMVCHECIKYHR